MDTSDERHSLVFKEIESSADRVVLYALLIYFAIGVGLSFVHQTFFVGFGVGTFCLLAYFGSRLLFPSTRLYQYVSSTALAVFAAQFVFQMHGLFEMHFFVFIGSALLIAYQNWRLQLPLILLVLIHHSVFALLQYSGNADIHFTQLVHMDIATFVVHCLLATGIVAICGWWSFYLEKKTIEEHRLLEKLKTQLTNTKKNILFAEQISKGNFDSKSDNEGATDELGNALATMKESLSQAMKREAEEKFVTLGMNKIGDILRANSSNVQQLCDELIKGLVKYMNLNQGGLFLTDDEGEGNDLKLMACYAFERKRFLQKRIEIGQGLIGQCYLERDVLYVKDVPEDYIRITSGLGGALPSHILFVPIQTQDEIVGVLEVASFHGFDQNRIDFAKKICDNIASSVVSTRTAERVQNLLNKSQEQAEEMRAQEEEMRQNMEELSASQEEVLRRQMEGENVIKAVDSSLAVAEFDPTGTLLKANQNFLDLFGYSGDEVKGQHHRMFVNPYLRESKEFVEFWDALQSGVEQKGNFRRINKKGETIWINGNYTPMINQSGNVIKIMEVASDVTQFKNNELENKKLIEVLENKLAIIGQGSPDADVSRVVDQLSRDSSSALQHKKMRYSKTEEESHKYQ
jgi:methyl-accepting chemotaxis protein